MRLVHLSDIHHQVDWRQRSLWSSGWRGAPGRFELHALGRLVKFDNSHEHIRRLVDRSLDLEPTQVLLTGDLTALGDHGELTEARALLTPLIDAGRLIVIPGNHDRYVEGSRTPAFERVFGDLLQSDFADYGPFPFVKLIGDRHAVIGLDSTRGVSGWTHYFFGKLGAEQLAALGRLLDDPRLAGRTLLLMLHHGPHGPDGKHDWKESGLLDAPELIALLRDRPVVVLHGHSHERYWHRLEGGVPHRLGAGSSTEHRTFCEVNLDDHKVVEVVPRPLR